MELPKKENAGATASACLTLDSHTSPGFLRPNSCSKAPKSWVVDRRLTSSLRISRAARIPGQVDVSYPETAESGRPL